MGASADTRSRNFAATIALVIHAITLGVSSSATNSELSFVIFFAIMIHQAPTSVLVKQGLSNQLLFSLAAPTGALLTWLLAHLLGAGRTMVVRFRIRYQDMEVCAFKQRWGIGRLLNRSHLPMSLYSLHASQFLG